MIVDDIDDLDAATVREMFMDEGVLKDKTNKPYKSLRNNDNGIKQGTKRQTLPELSPSCLEEIKHSIFVKYMTYEEAADFHKVKLSTILKIMPKIKKDPNFISKRKAKMDEKVETKDLVGVFAHQQF